MAFQLKLPEGWEVEHIKREDNNRVNIALRRPDTPAALPLISVEDYEDKIQNTVSRAITDWEDRTGGA